MEKVTASRRVDPSAISSYMKNMQRHTQLSHEQMIELFQRLESGDKSVKNRLIESNLRLVVSIARTYQRSQSLMDLNDLIQEGNTGLIKSIDRFKWRKGYRFSTYATWWIRQAITQHILTTKRTVRLPVHALNVQKKMIEATEKFREMFGCDPTPDELAEALPVSDVVLKATQHAGFGTVSLEKPIGAEGEGRQLKDIIQDPADVFESVSRMEMLNVARKVLDTLTPKESAILRLRFGLCEDPSDSRSYPVTDSELDDVINGIGLK